MAGLAAAFLYEVWPSRIRHPDLYWAKPCHTQRIAALLNSCIDVSHFWNPMLLHETRYRIASLHATPSLVGQFRLVNIQ